jgi:protein-S-isoprenylcysteine O-methyltransferase Ste14
LTMGLLMAPAAYHRQAERCMVTERFVKMSSALLTLAMVPFTAGVCLDTYLVGKMILKDPTPSWLAALGMLVVLVGLWFVLPRAARPPRR